jgi:hypothetical protein
MPKAKSMSEMHLRSPPAPGCGPSYVALQGSEGDISPWKVNGSTT